MCNIQVFLTPTLTLARSADETQARSSERQGRPFRLPPRDHRLEQQPPAAAPHDPGEALNRAPPLTRGRQEASAESRRPDRRRRRPEGGRAHNRGSTAAERAAAATPPLIAATA